MRYTDSNIVFSGEKPTPGVLNAASADSAAGTSGADPKKASSSRATSGRKIRKKDMEKVKLKAVAGDHRHRKTEEEEDAELLEGIVEEKGKDGASGGIRFESTPFYIKNGTMRDYQVSDYGFLLLKRFVNFFKSLVDQMERIWVTCRILLFLTILLIVT